MCSSRRCSQVRGPKAASKRRSWILIEQRLEKMLEKTPKKMPEKMPKGSRV